MVASLATIPVYIHRTFVPMRIYVTRTHIEVGGWFGKRRICIDDVRHPYVATRVIKRLWMSPYSIWVWWFGPAVPHVDVQLRDDEVERGVFVGSEADAGFVCSFLSESMGWASKQRRGKGSAATGCT